MLSSAQLLSSEKLVVWDSDRLLSVLFRGGGGGIPHRLAIGECCCLHDGSFYVKCAGYSEVCATPTSVDSHKV